MSAGAPAAAEAEAEGIPAPAPERDAGGASGVRTGRKAIRPHRLVGLRNSALMLGVTATTTLALHGAVGTALGEARVSGGAPVWLSAAPRLLVSAFDLVTVCLLVLVLARLALFEPRR